MGGMFPGDFLEVTAQTAYAHIVVQSDIKRTNLEFFTPYRFVYFGFHGIVLKI
jgi:hypothetical protein